MKRILFIAFSFVLFIQCVIGQQRPQYTQYIFNSYLLNPALSGIENYTDVKTGYRSQWTGLDGAPITAYLSVNMPIGKNFIQGDATAFPASGGLNPASRLYTQQYQAAEPHHGVGLTVVSDKAGPFTQTNIDATYAYHLGLSSRLNLAVGVSAGFSHNVLNLSQVSTADASDPILNSLDNNQWKPDLGIGIWAYASDYFIGVSAQQILPQNVFITSKANLYQNKTVPHYFLTGGLKVFLSEDVTIVPSVMLKYIQPLPTTYDINMKLSFADKLWIGGSYRHDDSYAGLVGLNLSSFVNIGYSYDVTTSALNTVSNGTHEIVIGILLNNRYKVSSAQHTF